MESLEWELLLIARSPTIEIAKLAGLKGTFHELSHSPYSKLVKRQKDPFRAERRAIRKFGADLVFFGPSHPTFLEEDLAGGLVDVKLGGFLLDADFWPSEAISDPRVIAEHYQIKVRILSDDSEPVRNAKAARVLTESDPALTSFHFSEARRTNFRCETLIDVPHGDYLVVSPGYRLGDYFTGLGSARWISQLRDLESASPLRFIFTGSKSEVAANAEIMAGLQSKGRHVDVTGQVERLSDLLALLSGGQGYVGKDSGTMHLAAALAKPVVAVFGGGHGKRFLPAGTKAIILTVAVGCRGCDWRCHLKDPVCVTDLGDGAVAKAWLALPGLNEAEVRYIQHVPSPDVQRLLSLSPGTDFPAHVHQQRREGLKESRMQACAPFLTRVWRKLSVSLKQ